MAVKEDVTLIFKKPSNTNSHTNLAQSKFLYKLVSSLSDENSYVFWLPGLDERYGMSLRVGKQFLTKKFNLFKEFSGRRETWSFGVVNFVDDELVMTIDCQVVGWKPNEVLDTQ